MPPLKISLALPAPLQLLREAGKKIERLDAEMLLAHLLGVRRAELYIYEDTISDEVINRFNALVEERASGKPLQYILGTAEFMGLEFMVTPDVFIPRPETELLVEEAIKLASSMAGLENPAYPVQDRWDILVPSILDLGAGSGNIAIALTKFIPDCKILISDISSQALSIAKENARLNLVDEKVVFALSDLFENLPKLKFDIIVSNPPYVASHEIGELTREISFEPRIALDGGPAGLDVYRRIINGAGAFLKDNGYLMLEIGAGQDKEVGGFFASGGFNNIRFIDDYNKIKRIATAQWISWS